MWFVGSTDQRNFSRPSARFPEGREVARFVWLPPIKPATASRDSWIYLPVL